MKHNNVKSSTREGHKNCTRIDYAMARKAFIICRSFEHKLHQRILSFFEEKEVFFEEEIVQKIRLELDVTQEHLRTMVRAKILNVQWKDTKKCYTVNHLRLEAIIKFYTELNSF